MEQVVEKCFLTGKELQKAFVECFGAFGVDTGRNTPPPNIEVGYYSPDGNQHSLPFVHWCTNENILWKCLKQYPLDIQRQYSDFVTHKCYRVTLGTIYTKVYKCWGLLEESELETAMMQAVVTYNNFLKGETCET